MITLAADTPAVRYLAGQGLSGMVSKATASRRKSLHAAAALAVLRRHRPEQFVVAGESGLETGADPEQLKRPDPGFLQQVAVVLRDCARNGLAMSPELLEERLFALSVSSRADALPRLSRLLRGLAVGIAERRGGVVGFDPAGFLRRAADAMALVQALGQVQSSTGTDPDPDPDPGQHDPEYTRRLMGEVRQVYRSIADLDLYGCGSQVWRTAAGARGVTAYLYAPTLDHWFSAGVARAAGQDAAFDPDQAWQRQSLWGVGPLATIGCDRVNLHRAAASNDGRLSAAATTRGSSAPWSPDPASLAWPVVFDHWQALEQHLARHFAPGLSARVDPHPVLLRPTRSARAWFDELDQCLIWPLADAAGQWIGLRLAYTGDDAALDRAERIAARSPSLISALAQPEGHGFRLTPLGYVTGDTAPTMRSIGLDDPADSDPVGAREVLQRLRDRAGELLLRGPRFGPSAHGSQTRAMLDDALDALQMWAEIGDAALDRIRALVAPLEDAGQLIIADALRGVAALDADPGERAHRVLVAVVAIGIANGLDREIPRLIPTD